MGKLSSILKILPFMKKHLLFLIGGIIGMVLSTIIYTPIPYITGILMDKVLVRREGYKELYMYVSIIGGLYILRYIISIASKYMFVKINNLLVNELRYSVINKVIDLPMSYLANTEKGYVQGRISECSSVGNIFSPTIVGIILGIIDGIVALITMFAINVKLASVVLVLIPLFFISTKLSTKAFLKNTKEMLESSAILNGECFEIMNGIEEIKVLNGKNTHLSKFKNKLSELIDISIKQSKSILLFLENIGFINNMGSLLILLFSGIMILRGEFTIGLYTSFSLYISRVFISTQGAASLETVIKPVCLSIERIYELLDMEDEESGKSEELDTEIESIKFEKVAFNYKNDKCVFNDLNFEIKKGESVIIKGQNGSGKSTIIKLMLGLYKPNNGKILFNNIDCSVIKSKSLRERIGIVSQNTFLFKGTVLDNILYGINNKNRKDAEELIKKLKLEEYINRLPNGLDTEISQNTSGVSGGQAQVIAFIRAMLSKKDVIILDEPISNVDDKTRNIMMNILKEINMDCILILISHLLYGMEFIDRKINISS